MFKYYWCRSSVKERQRGREREHSPFILRGGRLETSKKQGNHDNQTTNLGNQPGVLTVRARQAAQQGLIWAGWGRREGETGWLSPPLRAQTFNIPFILKCPVRSGCWLSDRLTGSGEKKTTRAGTGGRWGTPRSKTTCIFYWSNSVKSHIYKKGNNLEQSGGKKVCLTVRFLSAAQWNSE